MRQHRCRVMAVVLSALALAVIFLLPAAASAGTGASGTGPSTASTTAAPATADTSPVNLSAKVDMAAGKAQQRATVVARDARFEVLAPDVIRLEYSPTGSFLNEPTFNILDRDFAVPPYTTTRSGGWLTIRTNGVVLGTSWGRARSPRPTRRCDCSARPPTTAQAKAPPPSRRRGSGNARSARYASQAPRPQVTSRWEAWLDEDGAAAGKPVNQAATLVVRSFGSEFSLLGAVVIVGVHKDTAEPAALSPVQAGAILEKIRAPSA